MATETEHKVNQGLVLTCAKCSTKNFLDPYPFWNFEGNTKCAGCDTLYAMKFVKGQLVSGPTVGSGKADLLPGYAEDKTGAGITAEGKIRPAPQARPDPFSGKQKQISQSVRGKPVSGHPLKKEELVGSRAKFIVDLHKI
ncbi:MAG TPA: hypothetical protein VF827_02600 [Syntrophales bacterium]